MAVEVAACSVVMIGGSRIGVTGEDLCVARYAFPFSSGGCHRSSITTLDRLVSPKVGGSRSV